MADMLTGGYGGSAAATPFSAASLTGIRWVDVNRDDALPKDALQAGWTKSDGPTYVGFDAEHIAVGKINTVANTKVHNFWAHGNLLAKHSAKLMVCDASIRPVWQQVSRGDPVPEGACLVAEASHATEGCKTAGGRKTLSTVLNVMAKLGADKQGAIYIGRCNGEPGILEVRDGKVRSFWGHQWGEREFADILVAESRAVPDLRYTWGLLAAAADPLDVMGASSAADAQVAVHTSASVEVQSCLQAAVDSVSAEAEELQSGIESEPAATAAIRMKVLQFNIWQEGWEVSKGLEKIADVIIASKADIVTLSEVRNWYAYGVIKPFRDFHRRLTSRLKQKGWVFYGSWVEGCDAGFISKYPIEYGENVTTAKRSYICSYRIRTPSGPLCVYSAHLDWKNYALNLVRGYDADNFKKLSAPVTDTASLLAMDAESGRNQALKDYVQHAKAQDCPVILGGDFNECSHLDWTEATKDMYGHAGVSIEWEHSKLLEDSGFVDSWRELYPDPTAHMGATWPSQADGKECTSWAQDSDERDRIDFIYYASSASMRMKPVAGHIVGSKGYFIKGQPADATCQSPFLPATLEMGWPSDHKAVMVEFEFEKVA